MSMFNNWCQEESDGIKYRAKHPLDDSRYDYVLACVLNISVYFQACLWNLSFYPALFRLIAIHVYPIASDFHQNTIQ